MCAVSPNAGRNLLRILELFLFVGHRIKKSGWGAQVCSVGVFVSQERGMRGVIEYVYVSRLAAPRERATGGEKHRSDLSEGFSERTGRGVDGGCWVGNALGGKNKHGENILGKLEWG